MSYKSTHPEMLIKFFVENVNPTNNIISKAVKFMKHEKPQRRPNSDMAQPLKQQLDRKKLNSKQQEWLRKGHGTYSELANEKQFFEMSKGSPNIVCHFYRDNTERCKILDKHLEILAAKHLEAKFCKVNAEKTPFLAKRLRIEELPTIVLVKDGRTKDFIVGFADLGNCDDFATEMLEWRIAHSGAIQYTGDLMQPPEGKDNSDIDRVKPPKCGGKNKTDTSRQA